MNTSNYRVVLVTCPDNNVARQIASKLLDVKLIACANLVPQITSMYRWEGKVCKDEEVLMVMKTHESCIETLKEHVTEAHPYDVPEIIVLDITGGHQSYLDWIGESTNTIR